MKRNQIEIVSRLAEALNQLETKMTINDDRLLTPDEVSSYLGVPTVTLKDWRYHGRGPKYIRLSRKMIRYWLSAIIEFLRGL